MAYRWTVEALAQLKRLVRETRLTQPQLVEATGIAIATLQRILAGKTDPGPERLELIAAAIGTTSDHILAGEAQPAAPFAMVPVYDIDVAAGAGRYALSEARPVDHWPFDPAFLAQFGTGAELKLVAVAGDSQEPELGDGDLVMIDTSATRLRDGMHVVRLADALLVKRVQLQGGTVLLRSANPAYEDIVVDLAADQDQFEIVGRAVWASKML